MSRKKAARARKSKIRNQVEHAAEETVTMETEEMTGQEAAGQESLADRKSVV